MARGPTLTVSGIPELKRAFAELPARLAKKVIRQSIRKSLAPVQNSAKQSAPVGETGELKKNIKIRAGYKRKRGTISLEVRVGDRDFVGKTFYAAMVEFGTAKQPAQSYMRSAFDTQGRAALAEAVSMIRRGIDREAAALRRT